MLTRPILQLIKCQKQFEYQFVFKRFFDVNKKFYKLATVNLNDKKLYEIKLDHRKLKTPKGNLFEIKNESLAYLIAQEWNSQKENINRNEMNLTSLVNTVIDNPSNLDKDNIIVKLIDQLPSDTICYRIQEPEDLKNYLNTNWDPLIKWFEDKFKCKLPITYSVFLEEIPDDTKKKLKQYLNLFELNSLVGLQFIFDNLKSVVLTLALINKEITVDDAVKLSRLELEYQIDRWGNVEWAHDLDFNALRSRVSSSLIYFLLNNNFHEFNDVKDKKINQ